MQLKQDVARDLYFLYSSLSDSLATSTLNKGVKMKKLSITDNEVSKILEDVIFGFIIGIFVGMMIGVLL